MIISFVFIDKKPLNPERFWQYVSSMWPANIIRSKGLFWIASRGDEALSWGQAGSSLRADSAGVWWCSKPYEQRMQYESYVGNQDHIEAGWNKMFGDRKNELVIIGQELDIKKITQELKDVCVLPKR